MSIGRFLIQNLIVIVYFVIIIFVLVTFVIVFFIAFQKRKNKFLLDRIKAEKKFEQQLLQDDWQRIREGLEVKM